MQRRTFVKKASLGSLAMSTLPALSLANDPEYSILELMGKADIELFGKGINLRKDAHDAFVDMKKAAYTAGFDIKIVSSYRDFYRQQAIWERKYIKYTEVDGMEPIPAMEKIIEYSTIPGTSRHHWGTDIDIIDGYPKVDGDVLVPEKFGEGGPFEGLKKWLDENSESFGFHLVYTDSYFRRGFKYEPWHYSYAPTSIPMLAQFRKKNIFRLIKEEEFEGVSHFTTNFLKKYIHDNILDINPDLL
ncbi:M15 family metallopeptidase [Muricauda sp. SCSIO 64092]|uniref:M15 family metallopeptidase n=1 Tax=Allomuricauda sp. SCSIO 64092 TaxID=2908842 RepID=UPI001FF1C380|nr:M15 family metallopeptidase [Muricauda sp. SCSIO 64092]UOY07511.1 M15 family metallopeptidase [Muricauda sp. SCSIO 64092]